MSDIEAQLSLLQQTADPAVAASILRLIQDGKDHELNRINALDFSKKTGLDDLIEITDRSCASCNRCRNSRLTRISLNRNRHLPNKSPPLRHNPRVIRLTASLCPPA